MNSDDTRNNGIEEMKKNKQRELDEKSRRPGNFAASVSIRKRILEWGILIVSALLYATAFPPLNWSFFGWAGLIPLYWLIKEKNPALSFVYGYLWGYVWACAAFFWLREIEVFIPFIISFILALFPALWAWPVSALKRYLLVPVSVQLKGFDQETIYLKENKISGVRETVFVFALAAWWCVLEWMRTWIFTGLPWNLIAVTQWKNHGLIQICEYTGIYGVSFILVFFNISCAMTISVWMGMFKNGKYRRPLPFFVSLVLIMAVITIGMRSRNQFLSRTNKNVELAAGVIQANIPQCRLATEKEAKFALDEHINLSRIVVKLHPDIIIWPETAVPEPYRSTHPLGYEYRYKLSELIRESQKPFLVGTIDFDDIPEGIQLKDREFHIYNSAILLDGKSQFVAKYDKMHLVPFGEYTPFEKYFPQWVVRKFNMGRSCTAGKSSTIFPLKQGVNAALCICYEDIFPEISRRHVLAGANLLIVLTNDAWYPESSEPEQHLSHAVFRAVENRRPLLRCGNNSGTCVIDPFGIIKDSLTVTYNKKLDRYVSYPEEKGRAYGILMLNINENPPLTFYTRYGNLFVYLCLAISFLSGLFILVKWREKKEELLKSFPQ